jgi:peptide/nickel transport system permease protein
MLTYIIRRLMFLPVVLIALSLMIFSMMMMLTPVQRLAVYAPDPSFMKGGADFVRDQIELYGLDDPFFVQYGRWVGNILHGNLGWAESYSMPVGKALIQLFPATAELGLLAMLPIVLGAIWFGTKAAIHHNDLIDHSIRVFTILGWSFPTFVFALLALMIFYGWLDWFPAGRLSHWATVEVASDSFHSYTGMNILDAILNWNGRVLLDAVRHLVLPVITLAYVWWAGMVRIMRSSMLETLRQDYVTTARAKGLSERVVQNRHARRNALLPVTTIAGLIVAQLMGGLVITETIFDYHGLGQFASRAAQNLDFPAVLGFALYFAVILVFVNLVVDVLYAFLDPRVKLG